MSLACNWARDGAVDLINMHLRLPLADHDSASIQYSMQQAYAVMLFIIGR